MVCRAAIIKLILHFFDFPLRVYAISGSSLLAELSFFYNLQSYLLQSANLLLLSHSENYIKPTFVVVNQKIFLVSVQK